MLLIIPKKVAGQTEIFYGPQFVCQCSKSSVVLSYNNNKTTTKERQRENEKGRKIQLVGLVLEETVCPLGFLICRTAYPSSGWISNTIKWAWWKAIFKRYNFRKTVLA
jgi:hypothetical protein